MAQMSITGTLIYISPVEKFTAKNGKEYSKQTFVVEENGTGEWKRKVAAVADTFQVERQQKNNIQQGKEVTMHYEVSSREWQGKWYSNVEMCALAYTATQAEADLAQARQADTTAKVEEKESEDLPF